MQPLLKVASYSYFFIPYSSAKKRDFVCFVNLANSASDISLSSDLDNDPNGQGQINSTWG